MQISRIVVVSAGLTLAAAMSAVPAESAGAQTPTTNVVIPSNNATVSGTSQVLDAAASSGTTQVQYEISGGTLSDSVIATATPTIYGWLARWNTTAVANGTYTLQSVATSNGVSGTSAPVTVVVGNPPPTTTVVLPANNATVASTSQVLDAGASSGVTHVAYEVSGGPANLNDDVIATGTPTLYGWLAFWNTTGIASGTYSLQSVASYGGGVSGTSPAITVTVAPLSLAALDTTIAGALPPGGWNLDVTNGDSNAAGATGTETLQTTVSLQSASIVSCSSGPFNECEDGIFSGTFIITTGIGTLSGTASGGFEGPLTSESPPQALFFSTGGFALTVTAATGAFASTPGGTLDVSLQFQSGTNDFTGTVTG